MVGCEHPILLQLPLLLLLAMYLVVKVQLLSSGRGRLFFFILKDLVEKCQAASLLHDDRVGGEPVQRGS